MARSSIIDLPVVDLRSQPEELFPKNYDHHPLRSSQLLFNETIEIIEKQGNWLKIAALEQLRFSSENQWQPYTGWIESSEISTSSLVPNAVVCAPSTLLLPDEITLSYGTLLTVDAAYNILLPNGKKATFTPHTIRPLSSTFDRSLLVREARLFLEMPYLWGGASSQLKETISSVDCSGLIYLLYRAQGIAIPRDAHDQFLWGKETSDPKPGDPLYLAKGDRVNHVILKIDERLFMESPETGKKVRLLEWGKDLWESEGRIHYRDRPDSYNYFYRSHTKN